MKVGVLALQGAFKKHLDKFRILGVEACEVRTPLELSQVAGIVLPGGESTTMIHLLYRNQLWEPLKKFAGTHPTWGVCAGAILLSKIVTHPTQDSLAILDIEIERNAYGRQNESFIDTVQSSIHGKSPALEGVFIRAPKIRRLLTPAVKILFHRQNEPVMVQDKQVLATTFHPELTESLEIHRYFLGVLQNTATPKH